MLMMVLRDNLLPIGGALLLAGLLLVWRGFDGKRADFDVSIVSPQMKSLVGVALAGLGGALLLEGYMHG